MSETGPTLIEVLDKMKRYVEMPRENQPDNCPFDESERKVFEQHYHTLLSQCPAFANHKCPFDHAHSMSDLHQSVKNLPHDQVKRCPAFDDHHGDLMRVLTKDVQE